MSCRVMGASRNPALMQAVHRAELSTFIWALWEGRVQSNALTWLKDF